MHILVHIHALKKIMVWLNNTLSSQSVIMSINFLILLKNALESIFMKVKDISFIIKKIHRNLLINNLISYFKLNVCKQEEDHKSMLHFLYISFDLIKLMKLMFN